MKDQLRTFKATTLSGSVNPYNLTYFQTDILTEQRNPASTVAKSMANRVRQCGGEGSKPKFQGNGWKNQQTGSNSGQNSDSNQSKSKKKKKKSGNHGESSSTNNRSGSSKTKSIPFLERW